MIRIAKLVWKVVLLVIILFVGIKTFFPYYRVATDSMTPTLSRNSIIVVNRYAYIFSSPQKDDVVLLNPQEGIFTKGVWSHRIIGIPGDKVRIEDHTVFVNNEKSLYPIVKNTEQLQQLTVPSDSYFQKGDSENTIFGLVKKDSIRGKVILAF